MIHNYLDSQLSELVPETTRKAEGLKLDFALGLVRLMEKNNISNSEFAEAVGASRAYITKVLRGDTNVTIETMVKLAAGAKGDVCIRLADSDRGHLWDKRATNRRPALTGASVMQSWSLQAARAPAKCVGKRYTQFSGIA